MKNDLWSSQCDVILFQVKDVFAEYLESMLIPHEVSP